MGMALFYIFNVQVKMKKKTKVIVIFGISAFIGIGMGLPGHGRENLKVLPKDISDAKLDSIMRSYTVALGVQCSFCHTPNQNSDSLDFVSDVNPMKDNARGMMRMVIDVNKTYFYFDKEIKPEYLNIIHCKTCHQGEPIPPNK